MFTTYIVFCGRTHYNIINKQPFITIVNLSSSVISSFVVPPQFLPTTTTQLSLILRLFFDCSSFGNRRMNEAQSKKHREANEERTRSEREPIEEIYSILPYLHKKAPATYTKYATEASL